MNAEGVETPYGPNDAWPEWDVVWWDKDPFDVAGVFDADAVRKFDRHGDVPIRSYVTAWRLR